MEEEYSRLEWHYGVQPCTMHRFAMQQEVYTDETAYDYFCMELENILYHRFGVKETLEDIGVTESVEKEMLRSAIISVSHIIYINACFEWVAKKEK